MSSEATPLIIATLMVVALVMLGPVFIVRQYQRGGVPAVRGDGPEMHPPHDNGATPRRTEHD